MSEHMLEQAQTRSSGGEKQGLSSARTHAWRAGCCVLPVYRWRQGCSLSLSSNHHRCHGIMTTTPPLPPSFASSQPVTIAVLQLPLELAGAVA